MLRIGPYTVASRAVLAPMAGVTDRAFRQLCRGLGAGLTVSEMVSANPLLRDTIKSRRRTDHRGEPGPRVVQIAGAEPALLADFARYNVDRGAQIIDINMGCPAKKVCNRMAGSALLHDERLVSRILGAVVGAVDVPVTLKIRTGPEPARRNGVAIARIAQAAGIRSLAVHGRTRACAFRGHAEYDTIAAIKDAVGMPVIANGDIRTPADACAVLRHTGADAVMIGRAAQGNPWIFAEINHFLASGTTLAPPSPREVGTVLEEHLCGIYDFYGEPLGPRIARKHLGWYLRRVSGGESLWQRVNRIESADLQLALVRNHFARFTGALAA
ncbi:MAG: putative tRNA-dihydrouridine synthase [Gammaproteobacteria bacterium]|nr:putative tRNA-dihydrouridine synthase [Gammaproteobacteria bacterium]